MAQCNLNIFIAICCNTTWLFWLVFTHSYHRTHEYNCLHIIKIYTKMLVLKLHLRWIWLTVYFLFSIFSYFILSFIATLCLHTLVVAESRRRQGIGLHLLKEYVKYVKKTQTGLSRITFCSHAYLIPLYTRAGFTFVGKSSFVHGMY